MAASDLDKVIILDFEDAGQYAPDGKDPDSEGKEGKEGFRWKEWTKKMISELPAFLWYLLHEYKVPAHMYDKRYNVAYHNPEVEPQLAVPSQNEADLELMEIVERGLFSYLDKGTESLYFGDRVGITANWVLTTLKGPTSLVRERLRD
jgi:hypothetical protein